MCIAENQRGSLAALASCGTLLVADETNVVEGACRVAGDLALRQSMSDAGQRLVDGRGAPRTAAALLDLVGYSSRNV
jgi:hypothetical protein